MKGAVCLVLVLAAGCAEAPAVKVTPKVERVEIQTGEGVELTPAMMQSAEDELDRAIRQYDAGDFSGTEALAVRVARILYAANVPAEPAAAQRYARATSKLSLLTVRLNRFLHEVSPELEVDKFTMPVPYNPRIERQIDYYLTQGRDEFALWLRRSGRYVPRLREIFSQEGLPADLVYLALVESGFNPRNRSSKHAVGLFQFISDTAEMVGLKEDAWVDERRDPHKAANAAIKYLKDLYKEFNNWDLALAAYNAGSGRIWKSIQAQGSKDYWRLSLPPETEAYVPKFYATLIIAREPEVYGFNPELDNQHTVEDAAVPGAVDLKTVADCLGLSLAVVADLNPELTKGCTPPGPDQYLLRLPVGMAQKFQKAFSELPDSKKFLSMEEINRRKFKGVYYVYTVKRGDSLYTIARKYHTLVPNLLRWNPTLSRRKYIQPGEKMRIYRIN